MLTLKNVASTQTFLFKDKLCNVTEHGALTSDVDEASPHFRRFCIISQLLLRIGGARIMGGA